MKKPHSHSSKISTLWKWSESEIKTNSLRFIWNINCKKVKVKLKWKWISLTPILLKYQLSESGDEMKVKVQKPQSDHLKYILWNWTESEMKVKVKWKWKWRRLTPNHLKYTNIEYTLWNQCASYSRALFQIWELSWKFLIGSQSNEIDLSSEGLGERMKELVVQPERVQFT